MSDLHTVADRYLAMWNEPDPVRRRALVVAGWTTDGRYADPLMAGLGHEGIAAMIDRARASFPGHRFTLRGTPDSHGPFVRFAWTLAPKDGASTAGGTDIARLDDTGRFAEVTGFLDGDVANVDAGRPAPGTGVPTFAVAHLREVAMGDAIVAYLQQIDATLAPFGGRFRVHGGPVELLEGNWSGDLVIIEFPDRARARQWYASDAYRAILPLRRGNSNGEVFLIDTVSASHRSTDVLTR